MLKDYRQAVCAEQLKLKRSKIMFPCIILPLLGVLIGSGNFIANRSALTGTWASLWTQAALFYGYFFYPILMAVCASYIWRTEHLNYNWNFLMTAPVRRGMLYTAKLTVLAGISLLVQLLLAALYWCSGTFLMHFEEGFPISHVVQWLLCGWAASLSVSAMQLYLSMRIRSFAIPIGVSLGTCVAGLGFYAMGIGKLFPTSLITLGLCAADAQGIGAGDAASVLLSSIIYVLFFCLLATGYLKKVDVSA